jgi:hypothetical protein
MDEARPLVVVEDPIEGDRLCEELRAHGIKCACVTLPSVRIHTSPTAWIRSWGPPDTALTVVVHDSDLDRARTLIADRT